MNIAIVNRHTSEIEKTYNSDSIKQQSGSFGRTDRYTQIEIPDTIDPTIAKAELGVQVIVDGNPEWVKILVVDVNGVLPGELDYIDTFGDPDGNEVKECHSELIVGSVRTVGNVLDAFKAKADIVTIPPPILAKMLEHKFSRVTVQQFEADSKEIS